MDEIMNSIKKNGLEPGCIDQRLNSISKKYVKEIEDIIDFGEDRDITVMVGRKKYMLEVVLEGIEPEVDLVLLTLSEYRERYGEEAFAKFR